MCLQPSVGIVENEAHEFDEVFGQSIFTEKSFDFKLCRGGQSYENKDGQGNSNYFENPW